MPVRKGHPLADIDGRGSTPVMGINETFARAFFSSEIRSAVWPSRLWLAGGSSAPKFRGELSATRRWAASTARAPAYTRAYAQSPIVGVSLLARVAGTPPLLIKSIQQAICQFNKNQDLPGQHAGPGQSDSVRPTRLRRLLLAVSAGLALRLAAVIYGVLS